MKSAVLVLFVVIFSTVTHVNAQNKTEIRKQERELSEKKQAEVVKSLLDGDRYRFVTTKALTSLKIKRTIELNSPYDLIVTPDTIKCQLPYYGYARSAMLNRSDSPLFFESTDFTYEKSEKTKGKSKYTIIKIEAKSSGKTYRFMIDVRPSGAASLMVSNNDLSDLTFWGEIM